jgi:hypothetical protein
MGGWRQLHNEELHNMYSSPVTGMMKSSRTDGRACNMNEEKINTYKILVGKTEGRRPLVRIRRRYVDNIELELRGQNGVVWTGLIWIRLGTD